MEGNAEDRLAAALDDDATAELFSDTSQATVSRPLDSQLPPPPLRPLERQAIPPAASPPPASGVAELKPGLVLRGRYVLEEPLGAGGTAIVYGARDLRREGAMQGEDRVAIKFLRPENRNRLEAIERLRREFHYAQMLSHPNIARVFDLDCDAGLWFLTLELLEGETLAGLLKRQSEPLEPRRALDILRACGEALAFAHDRGVVHGDFKPGNIFINGNGHVRVLDFGAATSTWQSGPVRAPTATPRYASPQVLSGDRPERRDDIFSFGCVAYELLNGCHPFGRRSSLEARVAHAELARAWNLSTRQWHALESALSWDRDQRPVSLRSLVTDLTSSEVPPALVIPDIAEEAQTFHGPRLAPVAGGLGLAILGVVGLVLAYSQLGDAQDKARDAAQAAAARVAAARSAHDKRQREMQPATTPVDSGKPAQVAPAAPKKEPKKEPTASSYGSTMPAQRFAAVQLPAMPALISLDTPTLTVSEGAVAAVLRLERTQQLDGRVQVTWRADPGTAEAGRDFSPVMGVAYFADGQSTRAIYIPLLNDRLAERDETFTVEVFSTGDDGVRIYPTARAQATIRDDD
jgi:tRNA A-37 threonylcarbamoyl transferase component Bud32